MKRVRARAAAALLLCAAAATADCVYDWRQARGDASGAGASCFTRGAAALPPNASEPQWTAYPASAPIFRLVFATDGLGLLQTSNLDLVAFDLETGATRWATFAGPTTPGAAAATLTAEAAAQDLPQLLHRRRLPAAAAAAGGGHGPGPGAAAAASPAPLPSGIVAGALDAAGGMVYLLDAAAGELRAHAADTGARVWRIGLNGESLASPLWQAVSSGLFLGLLNGTTDGAPPRAVLLLSVFSPIPGVVTTDWLLVADVNPADPQVMWAAPVAFGGTTRTGCRSPAFLLPTQSDPSAVLLLCDTRVHAQSTQNTTLIALSLGDGSQLWNATLDGLLAAATGGVPGALGPLSLDLFTTLQLVAQAATGATPSSSSPPPLAFIGTSVPGAVGLLGVDATSGALVSFTRAPPPGQPGGGGWDGGLAPLPLPGGGVAIAGFTRDGAAAGASFPPGAITGAGAVWALPLGLPPPYSTVYGYSVSPMATDAATGSGWFVVGANRTAVLVGLLPPPAGAAPGTLPAAVLPPWPVGVPVLGSQPLANTIDMPVTVPLPAAAAVGTATTSSVQLLMTGDTRIPALVRVDVGTSPAGPSMAAAAGDGAAAPLLRRQAAATTTAATASLVWASDAPGAVMFAPSLVVNPANASQGLLVYAGWEDGLLYAADPATGAVVWAADVGSAAGGWRDLPPSGDPPCLGLWARDVLVCTAPYGSVAVLTLHSGAVTAVFNFRDHWAAVCGSAPFPCYASAAVLLDDGESPSGLSLLLSAAPIGPGGGVLALLRLPRLGDPAPSPPQAAVAWMTVPGNSSAGNPLWFGRQLATTTLQLSAGGAAAAAAASDASLQLAFLPISYVGVRAVSLVDGSTVWTATNLVPGGSGGWYVTSMALTPGRGGLLLVALRFPQLHESDDFGRLAALDPATGALAWVSPDVCIFAPRGMFAHPTQPLAVLTCANSVNSAASGGGPVQGKVALLSTANGSVVGWAAPPEDNMAGPPTLVTSSIMSQPLLVFGESGGLVSACNITPGDAGSDPVAAAVLPSAAGAISFDALNAYPAFTFSLVADADGVVYAAAGDDRRLYAVALPGVASGGSGGGGGPSPPPSSSAAASASPAATASSSGSGGGGGGGTPLTPGASAAIAVGVLVSAAVAAVYTGCWRRVRQRLAGAGAGRSGLLHHGLGDAYEHLTVSDSGGGGLPLPADDAAGAGPPVGAVVGVGWGGDAVR